MYISIYLFVFSSVFTMSVQVILNAFSIGCHTLHDRTSEVPQFNCVQPMLYTSYEHMYMHSYIQHMNSYSYVQSYVFLMVKHMSIYSYVSYMNDYSYIHILNTTNKHMKLNCIKHNCITTASVDHIFNCIQCMYFRL